jgi:hypothetical protein
MQTFMFFKLFVRKENITNARKEVIFCNSGSACFRKWTVTDAKFTQKITTEARM